MSYNFTQTLHAGGWTIGIDPEQSYGYFENDTSGAGGGLWFQGKELIDYDGVYCLSKHIVKALRDAGYILDETHDD